MIYSLKSYVFAFMVWAVPPADHWRDPTAVTEERYAEFAHVIASVALDPDEEPIVNRTFTAVLLASVASFESVFRAEIMNCEKPGMGGALGPYQHEHPKARERVCDSWEQATRHALGMLRTSFQACAKFPFDDRVSWYTDGRCEGDWWRSRSRVHRAERWAKLRPWEEWTGRVLPI
jgi:hypothetical protein